MTFFTPKKVFRYAAALFVFYISYHLYRLLQSLPEREPGNRWQYPQAVDNLDEALRLVMMAGDKNIADALPASQEHHNGPNGFQHEQDILNKLSADAFYVQVNERHDPFQSDVEHGTIRKQGVEEKPVQANVLDEIFDIPDQEDFETNSDKEDVQRLKADDGVDRALEEEMKSRRKKYFADVEKRAEEFRPEEYRDFHEKDDHLAFVTAGSDRSWAGVLQFVYSVQYHYPDSSIGVFDLGFSRQRRQQLETFCKVVVLPVYMKFWPKHMTNLHTAVWRPILWQIGLTHFGHIVYVEPDRFLMTKTMKQYIEHSRRHGVTVVGKKLQYSPFVVTNPEMYFFLQVDTRKLQRAEMFDISMVILHNSQPVRHHLMRYLVACVLEEYCIAPPGSRLACDHRFYPGSKKYANCHRYDLSAINILLYKWSDYKSDQFLVRDMVTAHYDGKDVSQKVKVCISDTKEEI